nr:immunoglobulin heavy chain junction region [Mus musculus]NSM04045.1 immunoglobulin heavy chain junction region [Mus musculus]NSM04316.1 immunoglobulin heavy chain junction region [Mus musculus]NSM04520.1 immunoglobulin heavy chain junction region [Mus musculus]NSM04722.1 immunoglobulin heavy chain junction region [Mus musculus]
CARERYDYDGYFDYW